MKKVFQMIGLISLTCFSFFVTEQTAMVVNDMDEIMIEIKAKKDEYKTQAIDAIIEENDRKMGVLKVNYLMHPNIKNIDTITMRCLGVEIKNIPTHPNVSGAGGVAMILTRIIQKELQKRWRSTHGNQINTEPNRKITANK